MDVVQKVDLLSASRCNLLSATLVAYQQSLLKFWENTSSSLTKVYEQFRGHPSYQFQMLKHIIPDDSYTRENDIEEDAGIKEERISEEAHVNEKKDGGSRTIEEEEGVEVQEKGEEDDDDDTLISLDAAQLENPLGLSAGKPSSGTGVAMDLLGESSPKMENEPANNLNASSSAVIQGKNGIGKRSVCGKTLYCVCTDSNLFINNNIGHLHSLSIDVCSCV